MAHTIKINSKQFYYDIQTSKSFKS